jgi:hypothetical protein
MVYFMIKTLENAKRTVVSKIRIFRTSNYPNLCTTKK